MIKLQHISKQSQVARVVFCFIAGVISGSYEKEQKG